LTSIPGLTVVSAGTRSLQASELLGSTTFVEAVRHHAGAFRPVIIDSPPVLTVTDARRGRPPGERRIVFVVVRDDDLAGALLGVEGTARRRTCPRHGS
jgi:hypothetical protein